MLAIEGVNETAKNAKNAKGSDSDELIPHTSNLIQKNNTLHLTPNTYNLGSGEKTSLNQLVQVISEKLGKEVKPEYTPARSGDILHSFCKIDQINEILTFKPEISIDSGIAKMLNYYNFQG